MSSINYDDGDLTPIKMRADWSVFESCKNGKHVACDSQGLTFPKEGQTNVLLCSCPCHYIDLRNN